MEVKKPTSKQKAYLTRIITHSSEESVKRYFEKKFPNGVYEKMNRNQAQKVITGMRHVIPRAPITGVVGRDISYREEW